MRLIISLLLVTVFLSCNDHRKIPDVSNIKVELSTRRFEKELFALDTNRFAPAFNQLLEKYPDFGGYFMSRILSVDPLWSEDSAIAYVKAFVSSYRPLYDTSEIVFADFTPYENELKNALQFLHYYFPQYKTPHHIVTYIGPVDGYGDIIADDDFLVGLHVHIGKNYSLYKSTWVQETYPEYLTKRFEPSYIVINCMSNIIADMYQDKHEDKTLLVQMVDKGRRLYILSQLLPKKEEYKLIGYTDEQMKECYKHEAQIWELFVQNNYLQTIDNNVIKNYVEEGPKTQELGEGSPGNIGSFAGWQIVKKYMDKNPTVSLKQLMETDPELIFEKAKYKP